MKNIIFDLGGVLLRGEPSSILEKLDLSENDYQELIKFFQDWEKIDLGEETLEHKFFTCHYHKKIENKYKEVLINYYELRDINQDLIEIIKVLKKNHNNVYILSDNNKETYEYYKKHPDFKQIDGWVISCNYHSMKKDEKLFEYLLKEYQLNAKECYFIDNNKDNIKIAKKYGIQGYVFNEKEDLSHLKKDMKEHNISLDI